jgi:hypothetical protein
MRASTGTARRSGTVLMWVVLSLSVIVGILALNMDGGRMIEERRRAQAVADAAALAAGAELYNGHWAGRGADTENPARTAALRVATANGYPESAVTVNIPPKESVALKGKAAHAEVILNTTLEAGFGRVFTGSGLSVSARSVGRGVPLPIGIIALREHGADAFLNDAAVGANLNLNPNAPIIVNSDHPAAYRESNLVAVNTSRIDVTGGYANASGISLNLGRVRTGIRPTLDPYAYLPVPTSADIRSTTKLTINPLLIPLTPTVLHPGVYRGGVSISGSARVRMSPGIYIMEGGGFQVGGSAVVAGDRVTVYNTGGTAAAGPIQINQGVTGVVIMTPPTGGAYRGISFFQNRGVTQPIDVTAPGLTVITGAVYAAKAKANLSGPLLNALVDLASLGLHLLGLDVLDLDVRGGSYVVDSMTVGGVAAVTINLHLNLALNLNLGLTSVQLDLRPNPPRVPDIRVVE